MSDPVSPQGDSRHKPLNLRDEYEDYNDFEMTFYDPPWTTAPTLKPYWNIPEAGIHPDAEEAHPFGAFVEWENNQHARSPMELQSTSGTLLEEHQGDSEYQATEGDFVPPFQYVNPHEVLLDPALSPLTESSTSRPQLLGDESITENIRAEANEADQLAQSQLTEISTADLAGRPSGEGFGMEYIQDTENHDEQTTMPGPSSSNNSDRIPSDADISHRPPPESGAQPVDQARYQRYVAKLRQLWLNDSEGCRDPTQEIYIPDGYLYVMAQRANSTRKNLYMYGHPSHYVFKSVNEFYWHLKYLVEISRGDRNPKCYCMGCNPDGYSD